MDRIAQRSLLYDFYGELLTRRQREVYENVVFQDLSLGEAAEAFGISRQGVHDLVRRCDRLLEGYEEKLHLVERFLTLKASVGELCSLVKDFARTGQESLPGQMEALCHKIEEEL